MKRIGEKVYQERRVCPVSGSIAVQRKSCQDPVITNANRIERKWHHQKRKPRERNVREKKTSRQTAGNRKGQGLSRFKDVKGKPDQEKVASPSMDFKRKKCRSRKSFKNSRSQRP